MAADTRQIRELIGENELDQAIQGLLLLLEQRGSDELLDQTILQKSRWKEYKRREIGGYSDEKEVNSIRDALLKITRELDRQPEKAAAPQPVPPPVQQNQPTGHPAEATAHYAARCYFTGDPNAYYVTQAGQILALHPMTHQTVLVAMRTPSMNPAFAWIYQFPNGAYYSIDHQGAIWGMNAYGMPMQMGYVQYL